MYTIIIKVYVNGIENKEWSELVDSSTKSGAVRKTKSVCKKYGYELANKIQMTDTMEGWKTVF